MIKKFQILFRAMREKRFLLKAGFLFLLIAFFTFLFPNKIFAQNSPKLEITPSYFDFGEVPYTPPSKYLVSLKNIGGSDLEIKEIFTSCHCTTAQLIFSDGRRSPSFGMHSFSLWKEKLGPNQEAKLEITLDPKAHNVLGETKRTVYLKTNDPQNPEPQITFSANVVQKSSKEKQPLEFKKEAGFWKMLPVVFAGALGDSINPCAIVTLLLFLIFMFALKKPKGTILLLGFLYVFGIFLAYFLIGLGLLKTFHLFGAPHLIAKIMAGLALLVGLATLYEYFSKKRLKFFTIPPSIRLKFMDWAKKASIGGAFGLGVLVGICEFPCTGGIYLAITGLLAAKVTYLSGLFWLLFYNLIFVLPLLIVLFLASRPLLADRILSWEEAKSNISRLVVGIVMVVLAILIWLWVS